VSGDYSFLWHKHVILLSMSQVLQKFEIFFTLFLSPFKVSYLGNYLVLCKPIKK
jgi:hypothetical protein